MDDLGYLKDKTISTEEGVLPKYLILKWQDIVNLLAKLISVPVVLIKKIDLSYIEIICSNESQDNPFKIGERTHLSGLYCEKVIQQGEKLLVPNAIEDKDWNKNLELNKYMCSYLGYPLFFPNGNIFGTICVLDTKKNTYSIDFENLIKFFKEFIEAHLLQIDFSNKFGETEQNYRNIVEQSLMGILIFQDNEIKYVNQKMADMIEYSKEEILNLGPNEILKIISPEFIEHAKERLIKKDFDLMISTGQNVMEMVKKSGETYWGQNFAKSITYEGRPAILLLQIDISKRKKIEEEVDLHKQRLESLLKLSQMHSISEKELIKFALEESVKLTKSDVGYLHFFNEDQKSIDLYIWSNNVMEQCYTEENSHYSLDKAGIWADCVRYRKPIIHNDYQNNPNKKGYPKGHFPVKRHMSIPVFEGNHIVVIIGVGNKVLPYDDTDIRQLTLYMDNMWRILNQKRSEMQYQVLFNAAPNGILITTTNAQILDCNPFFESLIGYKKEDIIGKTIFELPIYEKESFNFIIDLYNNNLIENHPEVIEYPIIHKNGNKIWIDIQISKIKKGEKMIYQSIIRDISARKKIEKILIDSENKYRKAYEQANFYKDLFSHDISNFIQVIDNISSIFPQIKQNSKLFNEVIEKIQKNTSNAIRLINNVRKLSDIEDNISISFTEIDVIFYLNQAIQNIKESFFQKDVQINIKTALSSIKIYANELLLDLFENILNNAIKYNYNKTKAIDIKITEQNDNEKNNILIEFIDNGIGIPDEKKELIFRKGNKNIKGGKGMGIGLSLVRNLVELYKGKIWIENRIKNDYTKGSNFSILFPKIS